MANIKNFGLVGIGSGVQFGKGGTQLVSSSGAFAARNNDGSAFVRFQVADPTAANDAVTKSFLDTTVGTLNTAVGAVQTELNTTQASLGLETDGSYAPISGGSYVASATTIKAALALLDTALAATDAAVADVAADLATEVSDRAAAVAAVQTEVDAIEAAVGLNADGTFTAPVGTTYLGSVTTVKGALSALDTAIGTAVEEGLAQLEDALDAEIARATGEEARIEGLVTAEKTRAELAEGNLATQVGDVADDLAAETTARTLSDNALSGRIDDEATARIGAISGLTTVINDETARAVAAEGALDTRVTTIETTFIKKDGSVAFTGDINAGGNKLTGLATPTATGDATSKGYVDNLVSQLGSAFNYVGTVAGGADADAAFDLSTLSENDSGDYYKVATGGFFKVGAEGEAFVLNTNDGIVKNTTADGWDKIDNTDSVVYGTAGFVGVTGNTDVGFTVDLDAAFKTRIATAESDIDANTQAISDEVTRATGVEATLQTALDQIASNLEAEAGSRVAADTQHTADIANLGEDLASETTARTSADTALSDRLTALENDNSVDLLQSEVDAIETATGLNADGSRPVYANTNYIANTDSLLAAIGKLDAREKLTVDALAAETTARTDADTAKQTEIDAIETGVGLNTDGTYTAPVGTTHLGAATSIKAGLVVLDAEIKAVADDLANLSQDEIKSATTGFTSVKATETGIDFAVNIDGAKVKVGEIVGSEDTNSTFALDMGTAGEVRLTAASTAVADVDIRLIPQGNGQVFIGETGAGVMQADDGFDLTVAGGDDAAGQGGSLILRAGNGTTQGSVRIADGAGNEVMTFEGTASPTAFLTAKNGTSSVELAAAGEGNVDLVLKALGTGVISVSNARISNVAAPVATTDAATKGYVDTAITTAVSAAQTGALLTRVINLTEVTGNVNIGALVSGTVVRVRVLVTAAFSAGASITIGSAADTDLLADANMIDEATIGAYVSDVSADMTATQLVAAVTKGAGATGAAKVVVEYISA